MAAFLKLVVFNGGGSIAILPGTQHAHRYMRVSMDNCVILEYSLRLFEGRSYGNLLLHHLCEGMAKAAQQVEEGLID